MSEAQLRRISYLRSIVKDKDAEIEHQADRIEQLEAALAMFVCDCTVSERCPVPDNCRNFQARRTMEAKCSFS